MKTLTSYLNQTSQVGFDVENYLSKSSGYARNVMPQIDDKHLDYVVNHFKKHDKWDIKKRTMMAASLKPAQNEINMSKVDSILKSGFISSGDVKKKVFIASKDGFLADGHHAHVAALSTNSSIPLQVMQTNLPIDKLLKVLNQLKVTYKKEIHEAKMNEK